MNGPHVTIVPGLAGSRAVWDATIDKLTQRLPRVQVEMADAPWQTPPHGRWAEPGWDPARTIGDLIRPGAVVVAHSFAATLTLMHLCDRSREQPAAAVLVSPFYRRSVDDFSWDSLEHFLLQFSDFLQTGLVAQASRDIDPETLDLMARSVRNRMGPYGWMAFMAAYLASPAADTSAIRVPLHIVYGTADPVAPPTDAQALARAVPHSALHAVEGADHFPMCVDPDVLATVTSLHARPAALPAVL